MAASVSRKSYFNRIIIMAKKFPESKMLAACEDRLYKRLFNQLDLDKNGFITRKNLREIFLNSHPGISADGVEQEIQKFLSKTDLTNDGALNYYEFSQFMRKARVHLEGIFSELDKNKDGFISVSELTVSLSHIPGCSPEHIHRLVDTIDTNQSKTISLSEFCDYYLVDEIEFYMPKFLASKDEFLNHIWYGIAIVDFGESTLPVISEDVVRSESGIIKCAKQIFAGGIAGAISRTSTAPLDRIKGEPFTIDASDKKFGHVFDFISPVIMQVKSSNTEPIGLISGFRHMLREGGMSSLWRGNGVNVLKIAPETALKFFFFEKCKDFFRGGGGDASTPKKDVSLSAKFLSGSFGGAVSQSIIYPLEVLKTRLVLRKTGQYKGIYDCFWKIAQREGPRSFYRGFLPNFCGIIPYAGIDLACYETFRNAVVAYRGREQPGVWTVLACGALSSSCGQLATYPLALIRTRMQAHGSYSRKTGSMKEIILRIWQRDGFFGFYRGILPNFMKVAPAVSISYLVYEQSKRYLGINNNYGGSGNKNGDNVKKGNGNCGNGNGTVKK